MGINLVVFEVCVVDTVFPVLPKTAFEAGEMVKISLPLGVPEREIPRPIIVPLMLILDGVLDDKLATPPDKENTKSEVCRVDVALDDPPKAADEKVTETAVSYTHLRAHETLR